MTVAFFNAPMTSMGDEFGGRLIYWKN